MKRNFRHRSPLFLALIAMLLCACVGSSSAQKPGAIKPAITGLVTMGDISIIGKPDKTMELATKEAEAHPGVYSAVVIVARWSHLEPVPGKFDDTEIENGMKAIRAYNAKYPKTPVVAKLRVFGGPNAPAWAKALDGGPMTFDSKGRPFVAGKAWTKPYGDAWRGLQAHLAARYDDDPLMEEVAISSCTSTSAEPFHLGMTPEATPQFYKAGYTAEKMKACLMAAPDEYDAWKHVALDFTFNRFEEVAPDGTKTGDEAFTNQVAEAFRARFGSRGVIANHGLEDIEPSRALELYTELKKLGPPMAFQTTNWKTKFDLAVQAAKGYGATEFEMWDTKESGAGPEINYAELKNWNKLFPYTNMLALQK